MIWKKIPLKSTLPEDDSTTVSAIMANLFLIFKKIFLYILMIIWTNLYKPYMSLRTVTAFLANWCFSKRRFEKCFFYLFLWKKNESPTCTIVALPSGIMVWTDLNLHNVRLLVNYFFSASMAKWILRKFHSYPGDSISTYSI